MSSNGVLLQFVATEGSISSMEAQAGAESVLSPSSSEASTEPWNGSSLTPGAKPSLADSSTETLQQRWDSVWGIVRPQLDEYVQGLTYRIQTSKLDATVSAYRDFLAFMLKEASMENFRYLSKLEANWVTQNLWSPFQILEAKLFSQNSLNGLLPVWVEIYEWLMSTVEPSCPELVFSVIALASLGAELELPCQRLSVFRKNNQSTNVAHGNGSPENLNSNAGEQADKGKKKARTPTPTPTTSIAPTPESGTPFADTIASFMGQHRTNKEIFPLLEYIRHACSHAGFIDSLDTWTTNKAQLMKVLPPISDDKFQARFSGDKCAFICTDITRKIVTFYVEPQSKKEIQKILSEAFQVALRLLRAALHPSPPCSSSAIHPAPSASSSSPTS